MYDMQNVINFCFCLREPTKTNFSKSCRYGKSQNLETVLERTVSIYIFVVV